MSIEDPMAKSADQVVVDPNKKAKSAQNVRYLVAVIVATLIGAVMVGFMFMKPAPGQKSNAMSPADQQRNLATAAVAAPAKPSPQSQNVTLESENNDLKTKLDQANQQNADLQNQKIGLEQQLAQTGHAPGSVTSPERRVSSGPLTGQERYSSGDAGAFPHDSPAPASPLYAAARDAIAAQIGQAGGAGTGPNGGSAQPVALKREIKQSLFAPAEQPHSDGAGGQPAKKGSAIDDIEVYDASQYVPANSYVSAKVLVGVDSTTGVTNAADPKPVLMRLEGPAVGVGTGGKFQETDLTGCMVNGAAYAELSSEKVYIKLQKMTCPVGPNKYMTTKVEGYVTYKGKAGVRGRVVSREGTFANKAFIAGIFQGLGQASQMNVQRTISGVQNGTNGSTSITETPLTGSQIASTAIGSGISNGASMISQYEIQRAEQYQPVIEMPTGLEVEIVFLEGVKISNKGQ